MTIAPWVCEDTKSMPQPSLPMSLVADPLPVEQSTKSMFKAVLILSDILHTSWKHHFAFSMELVSREFATILSAVWPYHRASTLHHIVHELPSIAKIYLSNQGLDYHFAGAVLHHLFPLTVIRSF